MRRIYFVRHAHPTIPIGERWCIGGQTDIPLNQLGLMQACVLGQYMEDKNITEVFSSDLLRTKETASFIKSEYTIVKNLHETNMGIWDGLPFTEIMAKYPDTYAARELDYHVVPLGGETQDHAVERFGSAVRNIIDNSAGDIAIVSHGGIMRTFFKKQKLPYTGIWVTDENLNILDGPIIPHVEMTPELCRKIHKATGLLENIRRHCEKESKTALYISCELSKCGYNLDNNLLECSALLHDIARLEHEHERVGGMYLTMLGYPEVGNIVRQHFEPDVLDINEAAVLFIADMNTLEDRLVSVDYRFYDSFHRHMLPKYALFRTNGVMDTFEKHRRQALFIRDKINTICGKEVIQ